MRTATPSAETDLACGVPDENTTPCSRRARLHAVLAITATYFYFLLYAEFAFLTLATEATGTTGSLRVVMGVLGLGGIAGGVIAVSAIRRLGAQVSLAWAFRACGAAAVLAVAASSSLPATAIAAAFTGASLGALTVTLASSLKGALGAHRLGLGIGFGTGLAYALCNVPAVFVAPARVQALLAAGAVVAASFLKLAPGTPARNVAPRATANGPAFPGFSRARVALWTVILLALVWLDSAAFYIIQHTALLQAATWSHTATLWANACVHLVAAVLAGVWLDSGNRRRVVAIAMLTLGSAALVLSGAFLAPLSANLLYTAGVSLYSVALVEFPARSGRAGAAAWVFGVAGWLGSALGIGMAQDLSTIPTGFVIAAGAATGIALIALSRTSVRTAICIAAAVGCAKAADEEVARGREVYIAEGCIHCHSQYVRPKSPSDVLQWGPAEPLADVLAATPPLFGTRRQGPDLSHVGNRRTPEWNRLHLISPQAVSPGSRMPSYAHLFKKNDSRGDALVAYLASLGAETLEKRREQIARWKPNGAAPVTSDAARRLFARSCAQCHGGSGHGDGPLSTKLSLRPPDWSQTPFRHVRADEDVETALSRIIRFGLPGLPMAGHEYLPDAEILGLARYVRMLHTSSSTPPVVVKP